MPMKLYSHWQSSASYRVRIALNLKQVDYLQTTVDLAPTKSQQHRPEFKAVNPQGLVPTLVLNNGTVLSQSMAIIEYLEELVPVPSLLPVEAAARARVRAIAQIVASDMHPLHTTRVFTYLANSLDLEPSAIDCWTSHWEIGRAHV